MTDDAALRDELALVTRSLEDARAEHARGELSTDELAVIERRDGARLAELEGRLAAARPVTVVAPGEAGSGATGVRPASGRRRPRWLLGVTAGCALVVALVVVNPFAASPATRAQTPASRLAGLLRAGELAVGLGRDSSALTFFDAALRLSPRNPEALVESGWMRYEVGIGSRDRAEQRAGALALRRAVRLAPRSGAAHLDYGLVLWQLDHDRAAALAQVELSGRYPESAEDQLITFDVLRVLSGG